MLRTLAGPFDMQRRLAMLFALATAFVTGTAGAQSPTPVLAAAKKIHWSTASAETLRALFSDGEIVKQFLNEIFARGDASDPGIVAGVKEHRIVDLDANGSLELVALADVSGRAFFNNVIVVYDRVDPAEPEKPLETAYQGFVQRSVVGIDVDGLDSVLNDIDKDGRREIVLPELLGPDSGPINPRATVPEIDEWDGRDFEKASAKHRWYYRDVVLPALERELQKLQADPSANDPTMQPARRRALRAKYTREIAEARRRGTAQ